MAENRNPQNNQNQNRQQGQQKRQTTNITDQAKDVLVNRMGLEPIGAVFHVQNKYVESVMEDAFTLNGVDTKNLNLAVRCRWNPRFDNYAMGKSNEVVIPFTVYVIIEFDKKFKSTTKTPPILHRISQSMQNNLGIQLDLIGEDKINNIVGSFTRDGKCKWKVSQKNKRVAFVVLDTQKVLEYIFGCEDQAGKFTFDVSSETSRNRKGNYFECNIVKIVTPKKFKKIKDDPLRFIQ